MSALTIPSLPAELHWQNDPVASHVGPDGSLHLTAGARTDWFIEPSGQTEASLNAPAALFAPPDAHFLFSARVTVHFSSTFDAGVLCLYERDDCWAKLCFEYAPQKQPMIVSVVTRGVSDDCNSTIVDGTTVYLRVARLEGAFGFHYSLDGTFWTLVRHFALGPVEDLRVGFEAQSPTGEGCTVDFAEITYRPELLQDMRSGA